MKHTRLLTALALSALALPVWATQPTNECDIFPDRCASTDATASDSLQTSVGQVPQTISKIVSATISSFYRPQSRVSGTMSGVASGDESPNRGWWVAPVVSSLDKTNTYKGTISNLIVGADKAVSERFVVGLAINGEYSDLNVSSNNGDMQKTGFGISPYFAYVISDTLNIDGNVGYAAMDTSQTRYDGSNTWSGGPASSRMFAAVNVNSYLPRDGWLLEAHAGVVSALEKYDGFTETSNVGTNAVAARDVSLTQLSAWLKASYLRGALEPYGTLGFEYEADSADHTDRNGQVLGAGFNYYAASGNTTNVELSSVVGRKDLSNITLRATWRTPF